MLCVSGSISAQVISGPMIGHVELRTAQIWAEFGSNSPAPNCYYWEKNMLVNSVPKLARMDENNSFGKKTVLFHLEDLKYNTTYSYVVLSAAAKTLKLMKPTGELTTQDFWHYRRQVPTVNFLVGSCNYVADTAYDRHFTDMIKLDKLATPYGGDASIFNTMATEKADAMLWLGDNWYTREADYNSAWGLNERPSHDRKIQPVQNLIKAMPQYAIWDDHDFGPNDCDMSYQFAKESRDAFKRFWANPTYGDGVKGIYTRFTIGDCEFFLLDDRTWRSSDNMADSVNGQPNMSKRMFGEQQMDWLRNALLSSKASFKIIATGSQMLNTVSPFDCFTKFPAEYLDFMEFLRIEKIKGLLFFTGDRHHTEIIKLERQGAYPLYDITVSPLTSGTHVFGNAEKNNPNRVLGIDQLQNYGYVNVSGPLANRVLTITFKGIKGEVLKTWSIKANDLR